MAEKRVIDKILDKDKALEVILMGFSRKIYKLATEQAASRKVTLTFDHAERLSGTLKRVKGQIRSLFEGNK